MPNVSPSKSPWSDSKPGAPRKIKIRFSDLAIEIVSWIGAGVTLFLLVKYVTLLF